MLRLSRHRPGTGPAILALGALLVAASACSPTIPEGQLVCTSERECPDGWSCIDARCYSSPLGPDIDGATGRDAIVDPDTAIDTDATRHDTGLDASGCPPAILGTSSYGAACYE